MYIQFSNPNGAIFECFSVVNHKSPSGRQYVLFANPETVREKESYADSVDDAMRFFNEP